METLGWDTPFPAAAAESVIIPGLQVGQHQGTTGEAAAHFHCFLNVRCRDITDVELARQLATPLRRFGKVGSHVDL